MSIMISDYDIVNKKELDELNAMKTLIHELATVNIIESARTP